MWKFSGNINGTVDSQAQALPMVIQNFTIVPTAGAITCNVYLISASRTVSIAPFGGSISAGQYFTDDIPRLLEENEVIRLATSGQASYLFNIENGEAPINK